MSATAVSARRVGRSYRQELAASTQRTLARRRLTSRVMIGLTYLAAVLATVPLILILYYLVRVRASSVNWAFFTKIPAPVGERGGMANAIVGTGVLVLIASAIGLPVGIGAGLYLAEQRATKLANLVRFLSDVLNGLPSIVRREPSTVGDASKRSRQR